MLEPKGDRYVGRFELNGTPINNVEVHSSLGGCAQRAVPFGTAVGLDQAGSEHRSTRVGSVIVIGSVS